MKKLFLLFSLFLFLPLISAFFFKNNVLFQSKSYEISGDIAEYDRYSNNIIINGSPIKFKIMNENNTFNGFSEMIFIKENQIEVSGNVSIETGSSRIKGEIIKFDTISGEMQVN